MDIKKLLEDELHACERAAETLGVPQLEQRYYRGRRDALAYAIDLLGDAHLEKAGYNTDMMEYMEVTVTHHVEFVIKVPTNDMDEARALALEVAQNKEYLSPYIVSVDEEWLT
jgi:hypothetical protein